MKIAQAGAVVSRRLTSNTRRQHNGATARYAEWRKKAKKAAMDYCFHMAVTGWNDKVAKDMARLTAEEGINSSITPSPLPPCVATFRPDAEVAVADTRRAPGGHPCAVG